MNVGATLHAYGKERNGAPQHDALKSGFGFVVREFLMSDHFIKSFAVMETFTCCQQEVAFQGCSPAPAAFALESSAIFQRPVA
jgi:hypothetical protein